MRNRQDVECEVDMGTEGWQIGERNRRQTGMRMGADGDKFEQQCVTGRGQQKILMRSGKQRA